MTDEAGHPKPPGRVAKPCPVCGRPSVADVTPFCSRRCADVDLNRWLGGVYRVPADPEDDEEPPPE